MDRDRQEANQAKLDRLMAEAQRRFAARTPVGTVNGRGGIWNGSVFVYGEAGRRQAERLRSLRFAR